MDRQEEFSIKTERIRGLVEKHSLGGVLLSKRNNFAWLTGGGQNYVVAASEGGVGSLLVTPEKVFLLANNIEIHRLVEEEIRDLPIEPLSFPWEDEPKEKPAALKKALGGGKMGSDGSGGEFDLSKEMMHCRHPLLSIEIERYRALGRVAEPVLAETCRNLRPGMTEYQVAARLAAGCLDAGIDATLRLVAFDDRIDRYRHPIPTLKPLKARAMVVLCARDKGLIVNLTRMVQVGRVDSDMRRKHDAVCRVDAALNLASKPGATLGGIFAVGVGQYEAEGFGHEWRLHHQGGTTGYEGRDVKGSPGCDVPLVAPTAVAWNPSITGTKSEDTFIVSETGIENLTESKNWPQVSAQTDLGTLSRCDILEI